ncbi:hypothetical protein L1887_45015 [Cichorium endivia]|nr:hypothetical protein L1887_45015 [Cichorium endivia]
MYNEVHSLHGHTLLLITKPSLQATALLQHLKQSLSLNGKLHNIQRSFDDIAPGSIILFDMMEADKKLIHYWQDILSRKNNNIRVLLLNTPDEYPFRDIESWPHINGVFYVTEEEDRVVEGLQGILRGECYFSQKLASYLITHSGNYRYNSSESALLTHREKEILNKLRIGASNIEIARSLFISENTRTLSWIAAASFLLAAGNLKAVEVEVPGLLTDHTVSSVGHSFYRAFSDKWDSTYTGNITINERPSARWGSWITITANQYVIYQTFLFPTKIDFDKNVALALAQSEDAINRLQIDKALLSTSDLAKDEF